MSYTLTLRISASFPEEFEHGCNNCKSESEQQYDEHAADVLNSQRGRFAVFVLHFVTNAR